MTITDTFFEKDVYLSPASFAQQRFWILDQLEPESYAHNLCITVRISAPLQMEALERGLNAIIERHEVLRTTFLVRDEQPVQAIAPHLSIPLPVIDLQHLPDTQREAEALRLANQEVQQPFDLARAPLLRALLFKLGAQEHILLLTIHHIIFDGWSTGVFFHELVTLYEAFAHNQPVALPDLPIQYANFATWQRELLQGEKLEEQLAYWKKQLGGATGILELPTDHSPSSFFPTKQVQGASYLLRLSKQLTESLKVLSRQEGVSLFMTLAAAFLTLLHRYSGQEDLLLGTVTTDRRQPETKHLIGLFANTLVLRCDLSSDPPFRELLKRVREVVLKAQAHQDVPFEVPVKELQPERSWGRNPLFQVSLTLEPPRPALPSGWTLTQMEVETGGSELDLALELDDRPEGLISRFEYRTDLFEAGTIGRMAGQMQTLLEGIVADPTRRLADLPLLTKKERHQLLVEWNTTQADYPKDRCVHQLFEAQVERTPEAIAVVFEGDQLTYRELNRRANQLAHHLQHLGVEPDVLVGICVERSLEMVVGLLGILKAGGAYVPLAPTYPRERLAFMLQDAQTPVLLTQKRLVADLPETQAQVVCLDTDWQQVATCPATAPPCAVSPSHLAYVIYTSGSTGKPKGVAIEHRSSVTFIDWATQFFSRQHLAGVLASTSINFDLSVYEIFVPLCCGGAVIVCENFLRLSSLPADRPVTLVNTVPSVLAEFLKGSALPASVRVVNLAGEPLSRALAQRVYQQDTVQQVFNLYGPTEDTTYSTWSLVQKDANDAPAIGRPLSGTQVYILDQQFHPVPIGVAGELYLGGDKLARCYLNRPELTAERFLPNPFSDVPGARIYKTGDLARYRSDGTIEHLGRLDFQVKLRGFRIELGEIEAVLSQHPAVRQTVVVAREDMPGDKRLVAYVVADAQQRATVSDWRSYLKTRLPDYMLPAAFVLLDALPLTPNGKVDRRALPAPDYGHSQLAGSFVAPRTPLEEMVAGIWSQVLGIEQVGIHDDFLALGGHSLLAMQVISRLRANLQVEVPLRSFFEAPTVAHLAEILQRRQAGGAKSCRSPLRSISREAYGVPWARTSPNP